MSRPEYPNCVMTSNIIHHIRSEQECYDNDPQGYEQREEQYREDKRQQQQFEHEQQQTELETYQINKIMTDKKTIYPSGLRTFKPHENAPDFVKCALIITPSEIVKFCDDNPELMTEYNGVKQLKCQMLDGENGIYISVDTWKKTEGITTEPAKVEDDGSDSLPF